MLCSAGELGKEQPHVSQYATMVNGRVSDGSVFGATTKEATPRGATVKKKVLVWPFERGRHGWREPVHR